HIRDLPQVLPGLFADAAGRARDAGFDGVELHYAHAYTMASFLSALNTRTDGYGGPRPGRGPPPPHVHRAGRRRGGQHHTGGWGRAIRSDAASSVTRPSREGATSKTRRSSASSWRARGWISCPSPRGANSKTPNSRKSARPLILIRGRAGTNACPLRSATSA